MIQVSRLIRLPNLFTAPADCLAGWCLATRGQGEPAQGVLLGLTSVLLYLGGIVLNDVRDIEEDRRERPERPLAAGAVSRRLAWVLVVVPPPVAMVLAMGAAGLDGLLASVFLAVLVVMYNLGLKSTWMGPVTMGLCRGTNVLLGASAGEDHGFPFAWGLAVLITIFVAGITCVSRAEARGGRSWLTGFGLALELGALVGLIVLTRVISLAGLVPGEPRSDLPAFVSLVMLLAVLVRVAGTGWRGVRRSTPEALRVAVKVAVLSLSWIHAAIVISMPSLEVAALLVGLSLVAGMLARRLYVT